MILNDPWHTAVHEAGHAVVGRKLGIVCGPATIVADDDSAGHSITADPWVTVQAWDVRERWRGDNYRSAMIGRILAVMAGAEAERVLLGECEGGDEEDEYQVGMMIYSIGGRLRPTGDEDADHDYFVGQLRRHCQRVVRRHWADIERVAEALRVRQTLAGDDLDRMLAEPSRAAA